MLLLSCGPITAVEDGGHGGITWERPPTTHTTHTTRRRRQSNGTHGVDG
nr:MAG TPA: hypothetical protein [Caudoviricetes sp.]